MRRGEIWYASLERPRKSRPVLLLSRDEAYTRRTHVTVAPVTRTIRRIPVEVVVGPPDGLKLQSAVNLDDIQTIPIAQLDRRVTTLSPQKLNEVEAAIRFALALR